MKFTVSALDDERKRIVTFLADEGYYRFHKDFIQYTADTVSGGKDIGVTLHLLKYRANSNSPETLHPRFYIRNINFLGNDSDRVHIRRHILENNMAMESGEPYSGSLLQKTYTNFARMQAIRYTNISFKEVPDTNLLDCDVQISTNKPSTLSFQPEGTSTAGDLGAAASLTYTNRNLFRGSELLSVELRGVYEAITGLEGYSDQNYQEYSVETKVQFPRFMAPFLSRSFKRRQTATSELSLGWD